MAKGTLSRETGARKTRRRIGKPGTGYAATGTGRGRISEEETEMGQVSGWARSGLQAGGNRKHRRLRWGGTRDHRDDETGHVRERYLFRGGLREFLVGVLDATAGRLGCGSRGLVLRSSAFRPGTTGMGSRQGMPARPRGAEEFPQAMVHDTAAENLAGEKDGDQDGSQHAPGMISAHPFHSHKYTTGPVPRPSFPSLSPWSASGQPLSGPERPVRSFTPPAGNASTSGYWPSRRRWTAPSRLPPAPGSDPNPAGAAPRPPPG